MPKTVGSFVAEYQVEGSVVEFVKVAVVPCKDVFESLNQDLTKPLELALETGLCVDKENALVGGLDTYGDKITIQFEFEECRKQKKDPDNVCLDKE